MLAAPSLRAAALALAFAAAAPMASVRAADCTGDDQASLDQCADEAYKAADATLNKQFKEIEGRLSDSPDAKKLLVAAQRAWIAFRDNECAFAASGVDGGSVYPMIVSDCLAGLTEARSAQFKEYLSCEEGDLSCPVSP